jgi:hypothetical protein
MIPTSTCYRGALIESLSDIDRMDSYLKVTREYEVEDPIPDLLKLALSNVVAAKARIDRRPRQKNYTLLQHGWVE